jgi:hypothetical protein
MLTDPQRRDVLGAFEDRTGLDDAQRVFECLAAGRGAGRFVIPAERPKPEALGAGRPVLDVTVDRD